MGQSPSDADWWTSVPDMAQSRPASDVWVRPERYHGVDVDPERLRNVLGRAPGEAVQPVVTSPTELALPMPDGTVARFRIVESPVMAPELAAQFSEIKTYLGQGIDDPMASLRCDITPAGFHAQILSPRGAIYIDPAFRGDNRLHKSYYKRDYRREADGFECLTGGNPEGIQDATAGRTGIRSGSNLRTYRLACAATGEYVQFHGGTVQSGMAAIVTAINRVTGIFEAEVAVRMVLVANNNLVVFTNPGTDPYSNNNGFQMLGQNQATLDSIIGSANYDVGHVFSTGGGGVAGLGVVCFAGAKGQGVTGLPTPTGDAFYVDYVAHEIGHQFDANHTFNSVAGSCGGNRNASTAYERGSGSTIMAYAGICASDDIQPNSDPYFHSISFDEIISFTVAGSCPVVTPTGNTAPTVNAGPNYAIPAGTPFILTASGSDLDGDALTYCWEERDLGPATTIAAGDNGSSPLFRSFNPTTNSSRIFPQLSVILANQISSSERLPTTSRTMNFRVTARDNRSGGGGVNTDDMQVSVVGTAGPFVVTAPNTSVTWSNIQVVSWNVAGTTANPINASGVDILLSTNGGLSFPVVLATNVPNDGDHPVQLPNVMTTQARIKVQGSGNIFFDVSNTNFSILPGVPAPLVVLHSFEVTSGNCSPIDGAVDPGETVSVNVVLRNVGDAPTTNLVATLLATNGVVNPGDSQNYGALAAGGGMNTNSFTFTASGECGAFVLPRFSLVDGPANLAAVQHSVFLGTPVPVTKSYTNAVTISVPATGSKGRGSPYPSTINVSGTEGPITKVTVKLRGVIHTRLGDMDVFLLGPNGEMVMLLSDAGHGNANSAVNNLTFTFDDSATNQLPISGAITSGTYLPTNHNPAEDSDTFPAPAPSGPYGGSLSVFNGASANGAWALYTQDDATLEIGQLWQGWSIEITTATALCCSNQVAADLALEKSVSTSLTNAGSIVSFTLSVTNLGLGSAGNVVVTDGLPSGLEYVSADVSQGAFGTNESVVTWNVGTLANAESAVMTLYVRGTSGGMRTNTATVASGAEDPAPENNFAAANVMFIVPQPQVQAVRAEDTITMTWDSLPGQAYRIQYAHELPTTNWIDVVPDIIASGTTVTNTESFVPSNRFYRILIP